MASDNRDSVNSNRLYRAKTVMKTTNAALGNISQSISANGNQVFNGALSAGNSALNMDYFRGWRSNYNNGK